MYLVALKSKFLFWKMLAGTCNNGEFPLASLKTFLSFELSTGSIFQEKKD